MNYQSKAKLLGLPVIHVRTTEVVDGRVQRGIARGWIMQHSRWLLVLVLVPAALAWWNRKKGDDPTAGPTQP